MLIETKAFISDAPIPEKFLKGEKEIGNAAFRNKETSQHLFYHNRRRSSYRHRELPFSTDKSIDNCPSVFFMHDDEYHLTPFDEDDLRLTPFDDEDAEKPNAPDVPVRSDVKLIPVICTSCKTRMYAGVHQVGLWKKCPDCYRLTLITAAETEFVLTAADPETAGGYELQDMEVGERQTFRLGIDYRTLDEDRGEKRIIPRHFDDEIPKLERMFNNLLTTKEEKGEERQAQERERKISEEVETVKRAAREGRLEELLGSHPGDSLAARLETRRRNADAAAGGIPAPQPPPAPPRPSTPPSPDSQPRSTVQRSTSAPQKAVDNTIPCTTLDDAIAEGGGKEKQPGGFFAPFRAASSRARMIVFFVCGLIGNFFGVKVWAAVWSVFAELNPGEFFDATDQRTITIDFWIGGFFIIIWLAMVFLFGISIFFETAKGKHRVDQWVPFNLDFGLSYLGWSFLMVLLSGLPGMFVWLVTHQWTAILVSQFICFPLLFLCVIESDTFLGDWPQKTLDSLQHRIGLWLRFYVDAVVIVGVPASAVVCLYHWNIEPPLFSATVAAVILTFGGLCSLFYFRRLGFLAAAVRQKPIPRKPSNRRPTRRDD